MRLPASRFRDPPPQSTSRERAAEIRLVLSNPYAPHRNLLAPNGPTALNRNSAIECRGGKVRSEMARVFSVTVNRVASYTLSLCN